MTAVLRLAHSPDSDDAFMFYALSAGRVDTGGLVYEHCLEDIETLNRKARDGVYEITALSFHAYARVAGRYALLPHGASFGDGYGPLLVAREFQGDPADWLAGKRLAVPGLRTSACLALRLFGGRTLAPENLRVVPFDRIMAEVAAGGCDGGLLIHEGQLTYARAENGPLAKVLDLGAWWKEKTGLPLPLGGNAVRKDLGAELTGRVSAHLRQSIAWGLAHRGEALAHALRYARGLDRAGADRFVGMYVNQYTLDCGASGREAVRRFLAEGAAAGLLPGMVMPEWVG